jgi:hypothetical protein
LLLPDAHRAAERITAGEHVLIVLKIELLFSSLPSGSGFFNGKIFQLFPFFNRGN